MGKYGLALKVFQLCSYHTVYLAFDGVSLNCNLLGGRYLLWSRSIRYLLPVLDKRLDVQQHTKDI